MSNAHPHKDFIAEALADQSREIEGQRLGTITEFKPVGIYSVLNDCENKWQFRFKSKQVVSELTDDELIWISNDAAHRSEEIGIKHFRAIANASARKGREHLLELFKELVGMQEYSSVVVESLEELIDEIEDGHYD